MSIKKEQFFQQFAQQALDERVSLFWAQVDHAMRDILLENHYSRLLPKH